jgi:hypothetical protein
MVPVKIECGYVARGGRNDVQTLLCPINITAWDLRET